MALHKSERHCPECDFVARKGILANHIRVHHKEKVEKKKKIDCKGKDIHDDLNKDKVTEEDIEYEVGDESPFVPLICEVGNRRTFDLTNFLQGGTRKGNFSTDRSK